MNRKTSDNFHEIDEIPIPINRTSHRFGITQPRNIYEGKLEKLK